MRFYKKNGKQFVDMRDDLLLTKQDPPVSHTSKSALPYSISGGVAVVVSPGLRAKLRATLSALNFIWS